MNLWVRIVDGDVDIVRLGPISNVLIYIYIIYHLYVHTYIYMIVYKYIYNYIYIEISAFPMICPILQFIIDMYCVNLIFGAVFLQLRVAWELISWLMLAIRHQRKW